jgi:predicted ATPase
LHDSLLARLDRLGPASQIAHWGAVLGREFLYEVLQAVVPGDEAVFTQGLAQLVEAELLYQRGVPPQAQYRFKHALIQEAAYQSLLTSTRQQYHQHIAQVLETRFPHIAATQPELLAQHYTAAGHSAHAVRYWQRAGERSNARSAYQEAIVHLTQGLDTLQQIPETAARLQQELRLRMALGPALMAAKGYAAPEVQAAYAQAQALCRRVPESPQLFPVLFGLWGFYLVRAEYPSAQARARQLLHIAEGVQEPGLLVEAHGAMGVTAFYVGHLTTAQAHLAHSLASYDPVHHRQHALLYGQDPWVACRAWEGQVLWLLGYPDQALQHSREALAYAQELAHPFSIVFALYSLALVHQLRRESVPCQEHAARQLRLSEEQGFPFWVGPGAILLGWALAEQGHVAEGVQRVSDGLAVRQAMGAGQPRPYYAALLAQVYGRVGKVQEALALLRGALQGATDLGEQWCEAELYRLQGELLLQALEAERGAQAGAPVSKAAHEAEGSFHQAIALAQQQGAKAWELRATLSLSQLWARQGRQAEAQQVLGTLHSTLPQEGMETADRQEASTFLTQWA